MQSELDEPHPSQLGDDQDDAAGNEFDDEELKQRLLGFLLGRCKYEDAARP